MCENEPDEVVEEGVPGGGNSICKGPEVRKADIFKYFFFSFGMPVPVLGNAGDIFGASLIPGPCLHEASVAT